MDSAYPGITRGVLTHAVLADLPVGVLLRSGAMVVTAADLEKHIAAEREPLRKLLRRNALFALEQLVRKPLLLRAARDDAKRSGLDLAGKSEAEIVRTHLSRLTARIAVTDAEIAEFYERNQALWGGVPLARMKDAVRRAVLDEKRAAAVAEYIRTLGRRIPIVVSAAWLDRQVPLIRDNPVDRARASGRPSLVDFGSEGCRACQQMAPILRELARKFSGQANVLFVHVGKRPILAARYGVRAVPLQVFFDRGGREVFRHVGFFPQARIEKKLAEIGAGRKWKNSSRR